MSKTLSLEVKKYFWGDNLSELNWTDHKDYIVQTLLDKGNQDALKWLFANITRDEVKSLFPSLKLHARSSNFWRIYLS